MSDITPNRKLARMEMEVEISQLRHNMLSQRLRIEQLLDEKDRIEQNITATEKAIADIEKRMLQLK